MAASPPPPFSVGIPYNNPYPPSGQNGAPANRSTAGAGGPPDGTRHVDDLLAEAERRARDLQHLPIGHLINSANDNARFAEGLADARRRDQAYVEYMLAYELIAIIIPRHKDFVGVNHQRNSSLYRLFRETLMRINNMNDRFDKIKTIIVKENVRQGVTPRSRTSTPNPPSVASSRPLSQQGSRPPSRMNDELFLDTPTNGSANDMNTSQPPRPCSVEVASSLDSISTANSLRHKPPLRPKPEALHGNTIPHGQSPMNGTTDELSQRFARLRAGGNYSPFTSQGRQVPNGAVRMPSPTDFSGAPSDGSMPPPPPPPRPSGPRGMPGLPPKTTLDTQLAVQMPKAPSPTYSPARNMQTPMGVNPPRSTARSAVGTSSRNNSIAASSASSRAPGDFEPNSYFPRESVKENGRPTNGHSRRNGSFGLPSGGREIESNMLFDYMKMFKVLLIDVRARQEFDQGHIDSSSTICIEPLTLRPQMTDEELESTMILSPDNESSYFNQRDIFDLVVCYDRNTQTASFLTKSDRTKEEEALRRLFDALCELVVGEKKLKREPLLLVGGIEAWSNLLGNAALRTSDTSATKAAKALRPNRRPVPSPSPAAMLAMEKRRRREYNPLDPEEEQKWLESARKESVVIEYIPVEEEGEDQVDGEAEDAAFYRTQEDFFRRFPAVNLDQESMVTAPSRKDIYYPPVSHPSSQPPTLASYPASAVHNDMPSRPPPAAARVSYSGAHDRTPYNAAPSRNQQLQPYVPTKEMPQNVRLPKTGLVNFGVTCYMNATIQCLNATIPLTNVIRNDVYRQFLQRDNWKGSKGLVTEHYANLIKHLWVGDVNACRPTTFRALCARFGQQWGYDQQQDAKEFLEFVLDYLHEDLNTNWRNPPAHVLTAAEEATREGLAKAFSAQIEWARHIKRDKSIISDLFAGQHCSQLRCLKCGHTSTTYEMFMSISVEIPRSGSCDIYDCLRMYCREEKLAGGEKWMCPNCKKEREAVKRITITRAPKYLVVHFKRFAAGLHQSAKKVHTPIDFPLRNLDISEFMASPPTEAERQHAANTTNDMKYLTRRLDDCMLPPYTYDAYAVMRHLGASLGSGHYISLVRDGGRGKWREFNDDKVNDFVPGEGKGLQDGRAYIVFFERTGTMG